MHLARLLRQSTEQVVQRLAGYGYTVPDWFRAPRRITQAHTATVLVSDREAVVSVAQVAKVAAELGRSREDVAHAYEEIGRAVLPSAVPLTDVTADDVFLLSSDADSNAPGSPPRTPSRSVTSSWPRQGSAARSRPWRRA
ncbi:hypothetical protein ACFQ60_23090 [Streptomyces zhihengii]